MRNTVKVIVVLIFAYLMIIGLQAGVLAYDEAKFLLAVLNVILSLL